MLTIQPVTNFDEFVAARELGDIAFSRDWMPTPEQRQQYAQTHITGPGFDYEQHRVGWLDGKAVAHVVAHPFQLRYGSITLQTGGIGGVCTHPDHRDQGYAAAVMDHTLDYMQARGDHLALLVTGLTDFYTKLGFHTVWPFQSLEVHVADIADLTAPLKLRPAELADLPQMIALFERHWGSRVTLERPAEIWRWRVENKTHEPVEVVEDRAGQIVGYRAGSGWIAERVADTAEAALTLLAHAGQAAAERGDEAFEWAVPADDYIVYAVSRTINCKVHIAHYPGSQWMGRIVDAEGFRDALLPEITRQAGLDERGFIFSIQPDTVYIGLRGQDETNMQLQHADFLPILFGALPPATLNMSAEATQLLEALFPPRTAMIAPWSSF